MQPTDNNATIKSRLQQHKHHINGSVSGTLTSKWT